MNWIKWTDEDGIVQWENLDNIVTMQWDSNRVEIWYRAGGPNSVPNALEITGPESIKNFKEAFESYYTLFNGRDTYGS